MENSNITFDKVNFSNNAAYAGGALYSLSSLLIITQCSFDNNYAILEEGGAMTIYDSNGVIHSSLFSNNIAGNQGGALCTVNSNFTISSNFIFNEGIDGGAIFLYLSNINIIDTIIINNTAYIGGGLSTEYGIIMIQNSIISFNNVTDLDTGLGGGAYFYSGELIINDLVVNNNYAVARGGGMELNGVDFIINNLTCSNNFVEFSDYEDAKGGCTYMMGFSFGSFNNSNIINNTAPEAGGMVFSAAVEVERTIIRGNKATRGRGGALLMEGSTFMINSIIADNEAVSYGGGILLTNIVNCIFLTFLIF